MENSSPTKFRLMRIEAIASVDRVVIEDLLAEDIERGFAEGAKSKVLRNTYERDPRARAEAIRIHGNRCAACGFSFGETYGPHGQGYIQVHHLKTIASYGQTVIVNPRNDMTVVCANCHSMIHRQPSNPLTVEELKELIEQQRKYLINARGVVQ